MQTVEDAYSIKIGSDLSIHGDFVYFTLNWIEGEDYASSIYRYDGTRMERVTFGNHEKSPSFNGSSMYYISYDKEAEKLMVMDEMKEPREIFSNKSISKYVFHGKEILVITKDKSDDKEPFVTDRLKYRYDSRGLLRKKNKLIIIGKETEVLVEGDFEVTDVDSNGKKIIFSSTKEDDDREMQDVYELNLPEKNYRRITEGVGEVSAVCVSDDGTVAYTGNRAGSEIWASDKLIFPELGNEIEIGKGASNSVGTDFFVSDAQRLLYDSGEFFLIGQVGGSSLVYSFSDSVKRLTTEGRVVQDLAVSGGRIAYLYASPEKPSVLNFGNELDLNPEVMGHSLERIEHDGKEAWFMLSGKDRPTVLNVHGGPHSAYGYTYRIEFNFLVENGFNVLFCNPSGSSGYGDEFAKICVGDWGGKDFEDIMMFLDLALEKFSLPDNVAITGGSYGGYMTNAAITKTDRFRSAISERCVSNLFSMCGTSDIGFWFNAIESGIEEPWSKEGIDRMLFFSPISHTGKVVTPTMFIHGEEDYRCPIEQSEQMYSALKLKGVDSELVRYQGDSHEHARRGTPKNMKDRLDRKLAWFRKYSL